MNPNDLNQIADAVAGSLAGASPGLLGCGAVSSTTAFSDEDLDCPDYECGGAAPFTCTSFICGSQTGFFTCDQAFTCTAGAPYLQRVFLCQIGQFSGV